MKNDESKKSGLVWIFAGIIVLAVVCACIFGKNADRRLREFFKNSGISSKESYVLYSKKNKSEGEKDGEANENPNLIPVPLVEMTDEFPTGCESSGAVMLLQYYGVDVGLDDFVDRYLTCSALKLKNGKLRGSTPYEAFIGNPREQGGYGCYAPVIAESIKKVLMEQKDSNKMWEVRNLTGTDLKKIEEYAAGGVPVLIWATNNMIEPTKGTTWRVLGTKEKFTWLRGEHCLVMTGADEENYYFNDPVRGQGVSYEKTLVETRYKQMGSQAVVIFSDGNSGRPFGGI